MILVAHFRTSLHQPLLSKTAADWKLWGRSKKIFEQIQWLIRKDHLSNSPSFLESEQQNTCKRPISCETDLQVYWDKTFCGPRLYTLKAILFSRLKQGIDFSYHNSNGEDRNPEHYNLDPMCTTSGLAMMKMVTWSGSLVADACHRCLNLATPRWGESHSRQSAWYPMKWDHLCSRG